jgi:AcrR family transcriptional regulator
LNAGAGGGTTAVVARQRVSKRKSAPRGVQAGRARSAAMSKTERRQHILGAARRVFAKRGYHQATVDDIVAEAGVARGTFYLYFEDKRAVLADLIDRFSLRIHLAIVRIDPTDPGRTVAEQVAANIRAVIGLCLAERAMTKILLTDATGVDPDFDRKLFTFYDGMVQQLTESLREGQALGIVADGEPRVFAYLGIGALKELLYQAVTLGLAEESADALTAHLFGFLCGGYLRVEVAPTKSRSRSR